MTEKRKHLAKSIIFKRIAVASLALAVLVGGGFGIGSLSDRHNDRVSPSGYNFGGIMTVGAREQLEGGVNADSGYDFGYRIYTKDVTGLTDEEIENEKISMAKLLLCEGDEELLSDKVDFDDFTLNDTLKNSVHHKGNIIYATDRGLVEQSITICGIDDPSTVANIHISNTSKFGYPIIEANDLYYTEKENGTFVYDNIGVDTSKTNIKGHSISLSGERYALCRKIENPMSATFGTDSFDKDSICYGKELATGKVFYIIYEFAEEFYDMLGNNPDYDFSDYSDEVIITVDFNDGRKAVNSLNITVDQEGKVYCNSTSYKLVE